MRWTWGEPVPQVPSRRILYAVPGPDAIYLLSIATNTAIDDTVKSAVLVVRDGVTEVLLERDDLRKSPPLLHSGDAAYAQIESGEMLKIPVDGSPAHVFSPPCERAAIDDDTPYLLRIISPEGSGADGSYFRVDRQDLATGVVRPHSQLLCIRDGETAEDVSTMLLHDGVPWINTRATIATLDGDGARADHVRLAAAPAHGSSTTTDNVFGYVKGLPAFPCSRRTPSVSHQPSAFATQPVHGPSQPMIVFPYPTPTVYTEPAACASIQQPPQNWSAQPSGSSACTKVPPLHGSVSLPPGSIWNTRPLKGHSGSRPHSWLPWASLQASSEPPRSSLSAGWFGPASIENGWIV